MVNHKSGQSEKANPTNGMTWKQTEEEIGDLRRGIAGRQGEDKGNKLWGAGAEFVQTKVSILKALDKLPESTNLFLYCSQVVMENVYQTSRDLGYTCCQYWC